MERKKQKHKIKQRLTNILGLQRFQRMRQASKNIKPRSNSVNNLQNSVQYERKNRIQTIFEQDKFLCKNNHNYLPMLSIFNQCLSIKKDFLSLSSTLTIVYQIDPQPYKFDQRLQTIKDQIMSIKKMQKLTLHIKKMYMVIIKNQTKHIHSISPQICAKDLLICLQIPYKIFSVHVQTEHPSKKVDIDLNKLSLISQSQLEICSVINPLQFIEQGIKLRASKMQSTGKTKKIVWGNNSNTKIKSANIRNQLTNLIHDPLDIISEPNKKLTPFNDNFQSFCYKKLDFSKHTNNQKEEMFGQLQKQMVKDLLKEFGKKLVNLAKQPLDSKINESKNKNTQMALKKPMSQMEYTLKEKNQVFDKKNKIKQQQKMCQTDQMTKKFHSRQYSDHSQKNLENFLNIDTQKTKDKKKMISYKTDISTICTISNSVQVVDQIKKTKKNKQNNSIIQKGYMVKKGAITGKKMIPSTSFIGTNMVKSIRMKTEAN